MTAYRYPGEQLILAATLGVLFIVILLSAAPTICLLPLAVLVFTALAYQMNNAHHRELMQHAFAVTPKSAPELARIAQDCADRLRPTPFNLYILKRSQINAYTFGLSNPRVVVVYAPLLKIMDEDELRFIIGHELGHVALNHTWLNTLLGGMAGVPVSFGAAIVIVFAFRWWNRACEFSADRAGLLACGSLEKATSALVKLVAGEVRSPAEMERALQVIDAEDDSLLNVLAGSLSTHPMVIRRIHELRKYAASPQYRALLQHAA